MSETKLSDQNVSEIDKAIQAAAARKALKAGGTATPKAPKQPKASNGPKAPKQTEEEKAAKALAREEELATKKAARAILRQEKIASRNAGKQPAHMRKVARAAEKLGPLDQASQLLFNEATANLTAAELSTLALHIQHFNRVKATERALGQKKLTMGQVVSIVSGDPRFIGKTGTITKAQKIRCYVQVEGGTKPIYLYTSDVQVDAAPAAATATA
jgi:hypothetical protein